MIRERGGGREGRSNELVEESEENAAVKEDVDAEIE